MSIREKGRGRGEKKKLPLLDFCDHFQEDLVAATRLSLGVSEVGWLVYQQRGLCEQRGLG